MSCVELVSSQRLPAFVEVHRPMQVLCKVSTAFNDVQCPVCAQGFLVYWTRERAGERDEQRARMQLALRAQHTATETPDAHAAAFQLSDRPAPALKLRPEPPPAYAVPLYS